MTEYESYADTAARMEREEAPKATAKPAIVIPTLWAKDLRYRNKDKHDVLKFSHPTQVDDPNPPLRNALQSLEDINLTERIIVVLGITDPSIAHVAETRVREIVAEFPSLNIFVFGEVEFGSLTRRMNQMELSGLVAPLKITSYGAIRNLGLLAACVFGEEAVLFMDDDEIAPTDNGVEKAMFGLGLRVHDGSQLLAKTGFVLNKQGSWKVSEKVDGFADVLWKRANARNRAIAEMAKPPRLQPAKIALGGCLAIHREMYTKIAFDPWIMRGEDNDYLINVNLHGGSVYFDDEWSIVHESPESANVTPAEKFRQEMYSSIYLHRKLEFARSQVDLKRVTPESLMPYPGEFIDTSIMLRSSVTALLHAIKGPERGHYFNSFAGGVKRASDYARKNCANYFAFQRAWAVLTEKCWEDVALKSLYTGERVIDRTALTGEFGPV